MEPKTQKALKAVVDALQHLSSVQDLATLEFNHIDHLLARLIDLPTEAKQKNSRRNLQLIRQWMLEDGSGIVLLEVLGSVIWRLGDLSETQYRILREALYKEQTYVEVLRGKRATEVVLQRIKYVQENKYRACDEFIGALKSSDVKFAPFRKQLFDSRSPSPEAGMESPEVLIYQLDDIGLLTPPADHECLQFMSYQHLAKNDLEQELIDNYVYTICPGRTLLTASNPYFKLLQFAEKYESTRCAVLSLSASYMKSADQSRSQKYHEADHFYMTAALRALMQELSDPASSEACFLAGMLLIHHSVSNEAELRACWSCHFNMLNIFPDSRLLINSDAAVFMSHQMILAQTAQTKTQIQNSQCRSMSWLVECELEASTMISGATGLSRRLSYLIYRATAAVARNNDLACLESLQNSLEHEIQPWTTEVTGEALQVALDTAETYRLAALIYLYCRCFGLTPFHPTVIQLHQELYTRLLSLPNNGPLFTSTYPVWPFFIASITGSPAMRKSLYERFPRAKKFDHGTLNATLQTIGTLQQWLQTNNSKAQKRKGWWEDMMLAVSGRETMLCLGIAM